MSKNKRTWARSATLQGRIVDFISGDSFGTFKSLQYTTAKDSVVEMQFGKKRFKVTVREIPAVK